MIKGILQTSTGVALIIGTIIGIFGWKFIVFALTTIGIAVCGYMLIMAGTDSLDRSRED